jgi:hypothetical protein
MTHTKQSSDRNQNELVNDRLLFKSNSEFHNKPPELVNKLERLRVLGRDNSDKYGVNWTNHSLCTLPIQSLSRLFYYNELYRKILDVPGVICEFGVQWGAGLSQLLNLRNLYEAHNMSRVIYGFDTFDGFQGVTKSDGNLVSDGDYKTETNYFSVLEEIVSIHESFQPRPQIKRTSLIKGDATKTVDSWLKNNPHAIISMAIFDMDIYQPTKDVLEKIIPRLTQGSLLVFDELNYPEFPGETLALNEVLGINRVALRKTPYQPYSSYCVWS